MGVGAVAVDKVVDGAAVITGTIGGTATPLAVVEQGLGCFGVSRI